MASTGLKEHRCQYQLKLPAKPGDIVFRVCFNAVTEKHEIKECKVSKISIREESIHIKYYPIHSFLNHSYSETIDEFIITTAPTLAEAEKIVDMLDSKKQPSI